MKLIVDKYKNSMIIIFQIKYSVSDADAKKWIRDYDFNNILKSCNYIALHDDPEVWVDEIYQWKMDSN